MTMRRRSPKLRRFLLGLLLALIVPAASAACPPPPSSPEIGVKRVIDGDTLVLADGRHLRFIGIDAMELGHDGGADQAYAAAAHERLKQLIASAGGKLRLESGEEAYDEHGRTLAYVFAGGDDLGLELIKAGLAVVVAVPPDMDRLGCYADAEALARAARLGIWSKDSPLLTDSAHADMTAGAFLIVHGSITGAVRNSAGLRLSMDDRLALWIPARDLARFTANPTDLKGRQVLVRGWLREYRGRPELDIHAPAALIPLP
jgi:endonuclease YncB( thermonuclease family)